jgi:gliding motility-associated lipoprotein GldH
MRVLSILLACVILLASCDESRLYEKNVDFKKRYWLAQEYPTFDFVIDDIDSKYNLYFTIRNESSYQNSNIYFTYSLTHENGSSIERKLTSEFLFDKKTGRPLGSSGLGDIYEHQFPLAEQYSFHETGTYFIRYEQFMRTDTLRGIVSVGVRVEKAQ